MSAIDRLRAALASPDYGLAGIDPDDVRDGSRGGARRRGCDGCGARGGGAVSALDTLRAALADYDRACVDHGDVIDRIGALQRAGQHRGPARDRLSDEARPIEARMRAAETALESAACALLSTVAGESAGEWLRGRLDYDGAGP